mgnify:CR=1 FL=1
MSSNTYFLEKNPIDDRFKVDDQDGFPFGDGKMPNDAIHGARALGITEPIHFGSGVNVNDEKDVFTTDELISELANLAGMKVKCVYNNDMNIIGWTMELIE